MKSLHLLFLFGVIVCVLSAETVPQRVEEARQDIKHAKDTIKHAEELLSASDPGLLSRATEKVKEMLSPTPPAPEPETEQSLLQRLRNYFRPEHETTASTAASAAADAAGRIKESAKENANSLLERLRSYFGRGQAPSTTAQAAGDTAESVLERLRAIFKDAEVAAGASKGAARGAAETVGQKVGEATQSLADKVRAALGYGSETMASIEQKLHTEPSTLDKIKQALGMQTEPTLAQKVKDTLGVHEPSTLEKIKTKLGMQTEPSMTDKIKGKLGIEPQAQDSLADRIRAAVGIEKPQETIGEKIKHAVGLGTAPAETVGEKIKAGVKSAMGVDTDNVKASLGLGPKPTVVERLKAYFGVHEPTTTEKMKASFDESIAAARSQIEDKINALRKATGTSRQSAYQDLVDTLNRARSDMTSRADTIYEALAHPVDTVKDAAKGVADKVAGAVSPVPAEETPGLLKRARDDMSARINSLYDTIASTSRGWASDIDSLTERVKSAFGRGSSYLLQSSNYEDGITSFYVNDNGNEYMDITGKNVDSSFDKLKALNWFRSQYELPKYEEFPSNVTVQTHPLKRAHVLIKSNRFVDGNQFEYTYDDGQETLNVVWAGEAPKIFSKEMQARIIDGFRQTHGLMPSPSAVPTIRATISPHANIGEKKRDEL